MTKEQSFTEILSRAGNGDADAVSTLLPLVYEELRRLATHYLRSERRDHTLQPTALVHEAYLRLVGSDRGWSGRSQFLAAAATAMQRVLVDFARQRTSQKRGGGVTIAGGDTDGPSELRRDFQILELNELIERLREVSERKARLVELRFFAGMTNVEISEVLGISLPIVAKEWAFARAWLTAQLSASESPV